MMLTLEIRQDPPELMDPMTLFTSATVMHSEWRATDFDMERMTVEFELEEKLGLRMAQKRARESRRHSSPSLSLPPSLTSTAMATAAVPTEALYWMAPQEREGIHDTASLVERDIEGLIWESRRRAEATSRRNSHDSATTPPTAATDPFSSVLWDSNFFHCTRLSLPPVLASAQISFKAHRNMSAPWVVQRECLLDPFLSVLSSSPVHQNAHERVLAFRQNRMLLRTLSNMKSRNESSQVQFLPETVELDARELGQRKARGTSRRSVQPDRGEDEPRLGPVWQFFERFYRRGMGFIPSLSSRDTKTGYRSLERDSQSPRPAVVSAVTAPTKPCSCHESRDSLVIPKDTSNEGEPRDNEERRQQFEFTYDVRHNYLLCSRLEGERVIRPIRFSCTLDFFTKDESSS
ncbi:MAG: hypothetical protein J3Q66DRAFT_358778 [Benniella sp.]|nr:MAG: hypothetical protein J3Q66DRAFT_358778 [Benniella sp.]